MKKVLLVLLSCCWGLCLYAQNENERQICDQAEQYYQLGRLDEAVTFLEGNVKNLSTLPKITALKLLALCYLEQDKTELAEKNVSLLLKEDPYYNITLNDPPRFVDMITNLKRGESATITTASQQAESIDEAPVPVTLITEDMIKKCGARNLRDVLMAYVPGISPIEGEETNVSMRGVYSYSQENILIMRDGHRLNSSSTNSIAPDYRISLDNIKQIEVLRGAASSLYGNVALTAVVNIITKSGRDIDGMKVAYGMGDNHTFKGSLLMGKRFMDSDIAFWATVYSSDGYKFNIDRNHRDFYGLIPKDGYLYVDGYNGRPSYDIGLNYKWKNFTLSLGHQSGKRVHTYNSLFFLTTYDYDRYKSIDGVKPGRTISTTYAVMDYNKAFKNLNINANVSLDYESANLYNILGDTIPDAFSNVGDIYYPTDEYLKDSLVLHSGVFEIQNWKALTLSGELKVMQNYKLGNHKGNYVLGAQVSRFHSFYNEMLIGDKYERIDMSTVDDRTGIYQNGKEYSLSVYGQVKHYFSPKLIFNGGVRYDFKKRFNDKKVNVLSPRVALIYLPSSNWNVKLSYAHSYVDAPFFYRASKTLYLGNVNLEPQMQDSYQLSSTVRIKPWHLTYDGNIFFNRSDDIIMMGVNSYQNSGKLDMMGLENTLSFKVPHTFANLNMIYQHLLTTASYNTYKKNICAVPNFMMNLTLEQELATFIKNLWIGTNIGLKSKSYDVIFKDYVFKDNQPVKSNYKNNAICLLDLGLRYTYKFASIDARCYNLLNTKYRLGGDRVPIPQPGRTFLATVSFDFD